MAYVDFLLKAHQSTKRNYLDRVNQANKAECAEIAIQFGKDYWDGDRKYGYGGYSYDGRQRKIAEDMAKHYGLKPGDRILDVGCGKGYLLHEFTQVLPGVEVVGIDISEYALENAKEEVKPFLEVGNAVSLPYEDHSFDYVVTINTLHNLYNYELDQAIREIQRVGKGEQKHIAIEVYTNERQKANLLYWQLTCRAFYTPKEWEWLFDQCGYKGDYSYILFD